MPRSGSVDYRSGLDRLPAAHKLSLARGGRQAEAELPTLIPNLP